METSTPVHNYANLRSTPQDPHPMPRKRAALVLQKDARLHPCRGVRFAKKNHRPPVPSAACDPALSISQRRRPDRIELHRPFACGTPPHGVELLSRRMATPPLDCRGPVQPPPPGAAAPPSECRAPRAPPIQLPPPGAAPPSDCRARGAPPTQVRDAPPPWLGNRRHPSASGAALCSACIFFASTCDL